MQHIPLSKCILDGYTDTNFDNRDLLGVSISCDSNVMTNGFSCDFIRAGFMFDDNVGYDITFGFN